MATTAWRLGTGATYALDKNTDLNLSWEVVWMGDLSVDQTIPLSGQRTSGQFSNAWIQTLTGNMTWRF
jgi:long-chain fatty acid transport protein